MSAFLPKNALTYGVLVPWLFGVALTCFYLHYISVAHFQPYTDDTEKSWGFGQIGAMITLAGPLYEGFRLARESAGRQHNEDFFLSNCQFMSVISDMGQDAGASLLSCYSTRGAHVLLCSLYSFSHIHNLTQRMLLAPVRLNVPILEVCHNVHLPR